MKMFLFTLAVVGFSFDINSAGCCSCCNSCKSNNGNGGGGSGNLGPKKSIPGGGPGKPTPPETDKFDADIIVDADSVTIKPVGDSEIKLVDGNKVDLNVTKLVEDSYLMCTVAYKFKYSKMIKNANVTVDDDGLKNTTYLIAIMCLKGDESTKYIIIVSNKNGDMSTLFNGVNLAEISLLASAGITSMTNMFLSCKNLSKCNINIDTSEVRYMPGIFYECESLKFLDLSNFDTREVTDMSFMFANCKSLKSLDLSNFDTCKVTSMRHMFDVCESLQELKLSAKFNTSNVTNMCNMFDRCAINELDLTNFIFDKCKDKSLDGLFNNSKISKIKFGNHNINITCSCNNIFDNCSNLKEVTFELKPTNKLISALNGINLKPSDDGKIWKKITKKKVKK